MNRTVCSEWGKKRWLYAGLSLVLMLFLGLIYAWSVFRVPLQAEFGWTASQCSVTFSISMMTFSVGGLLSGVITGRRGARDTLLLCALCLTAGFIGASHISTHAGICFTYGGLCGFGVGLGYNAVIGTVITWFPDRQGLISGLTLMGFGFGSMLLGTVGAKLIMVFGWRRAFFLFGVVFAVIFAAASVFLRPAPADFLEHFCTEKGKIRPALEEADYRTMLRRKNFWLFFCWAIAVSSAGLVIMNLSGVYADWALSGELTMTAMMAGVISVSNGVSRVLFGQLFDRRGYRVSMLWDVFLYLLAAGLLAASYVVRTPAMLVTAYVICGLAYGGISPNISAFVAYFFGKKNYALNYSIAYLNPLVASCVSMVVGGGAYLTQFFCISIFALLGLVFLLLIRGKTGVGETQF